MAARPVTITLSHDLGKEEARSRVDDGFDKLTSGMAGGMVLKTTREWTGDKLNFTAKGMGQNIFGFIEVYPQHVQIEVTLPALLAGIAETLTGKMKKEGQILLEKK